MTRRLPSLLLAATTSAFLFACGNARDVSGTSASQEVACTRCHGGGDNETGAPPRSIAGVTDAGARPVGAHTAHVAGGALSGPLACTACHPDPREGSTAHTDGQITLTFGALATASGALSPAWNAENATCASTYCHGNFTGGNATSPLWTAGDAGAACGSCHGEVTRTDVPALPRTNHPALAAGATLATCARCHPETVDAQGAVLAAGGKHVDGVVETLEAAKHPAGWASPALHGQAAAQDVRACTACHAARAPAAVTTVTCGMCHDALAGGDWTVTCNVCHGGTNAAPPRDLSDNTATTARGVGAHQSHVTGASGLGPALSCEFCHPATTNVFDLRHLNGQLDVTGYTGADPVWQDAASEPPGWDPGSATCATSYCHGAFRPGATPFVPVWTSVGQGEADCGTCHGVPPLPSHATIPAQLTECSGCHASTVDTSGNILAGGTHLDGVVEALGGHDDAFKYGVTSATFHALEANQGLTRCQLCHGQELTGGLTGPTCTTCHGAGFPTNCGGCHGDRAARTGSPPRATFGFRDDPIRVGAHASHVAGALGSSFDCAVCHQKPASAFDAGHVDGGTAEVVFGGVARADGATPTAWNRADATCAGTYCHGATLSGGTLKTPLWTGTGQAGCGSCHGVPPPPPHVANFDCGRCHAGYTDHSVNVGTHVDGSVDLANLTCSSCHGSATNPAPPTGTAGESSTSDRAVGAHQSHVQGGALSDGMACDLCHITPAADAMGHADGTVNITFGVLAGVGATWQPASLTCASTYCHGASLGGGDLKTPLWTGSGQATCGSCHGLPPPSPHVQNTACGSCHAGYTSSAVNPATHVNGALDVAGLTCSSCHGSAANAAPPLGTRGETAATERAVGAHQKHVVGGLLARPIGCEVCHTLPATMNHPDGVARVTFGAEAGAGAAWNVPALTCSSTYCHGATLAAGGSQQTPLWTGGAAQAACGTCHGLPPPPPHSQNPSCGGCHGAGYSSSTVNAATHVDGDVQLVGMTCASCHGDAARAGSDELKAAPPTGVNGETATSTRAVGAHQRHLSGGAVGPAVACGECHAVPTSPGHPDGVAQVALGALSSRDGVAAAYDPASVTCTTYCHGASLSGGGDVPPLWTGGAAEADCGSCHGAPPPAPHVSSPDCGRCHGAGYTQAAVNLATHMNGTLDVLALTCSSCHGDPARAGDDTRKAAPPTGSRGETATTERAVGAHERHLTGGALGPAVACTQCHVVPATGDTAHVNGVAAVAFGSLWSRGGATPAWNTPALTCTTYCHGATLPGGSIPAPSWTGGASQTACGTCHGRPPPAPHVQNAQCGSCHTGYTGSSVNAATHMNGTLEVIELTCSSCHGDPARVGSDAVKAAPPYGTNGETATTQRAVGAHQKHLTSTTSQPVACEECHAVPASMSHPTGAVDLAWGTLARTGGATPSFSSAALTCTNYCHGATLVGGTLTAPLWTGGSTQVSSCSSCHGNPPNTGGILNPTTGGRFRGHTEHLRSCGNCHGADRTAYHVDGQVHVEITGYDLSTADPCDLTIVVLQGVKQANGDWACGTCHEIKPSEGDGCF